MKKVNKFLSPLVALFMVLGVAGVVNVFAESPHSASIAIEDINGNSEPFDFSCPNNPLFSPVTVSGSGQLVNPQGQFPEQYHVSIDWGDGSPLEVLDFDPLSSGLSYITTPGTGHDSTVDFDYEFGPHEYDVNTGFSITVKVYHAQNSGQDATDAIATVVTTCVVPHPAFLTVVKHVVGGDLLASGFMMHVLVDGEDVSVSPFAGDENGTEVQVEPGTYTVSEDSNSDYDASFSEGCPAGVITLGDDAHLTCTVTNTYNVNPPSPECSDGVDNADAEDSLVDAADPGCWTNPNDSNTYDPNDNSETLVDACPNDAGFQTDAENCNTTGTLIVKKVVTKDNGGTATADDFSFVVNGGDAVAFEADGQNDLTVTAGVYTVTEPAASGYTTTYDNCSEITVPVNGSATCTITNNDQQGTLTVKKVIVNNESVNYGAFSFVVNEAAAVFFDNSDGQNDLTVDAGTYTVTEVPVLNYTTDYSNCSNVEVANGSTATCTITNTFVPDLGCTDDSANNFDEDATNDDGSCMYDASITVVKNTVGANGTFHFDGLDGEDGFSLSTSGNTASTSFTVSVDADGGTFGVTEDGQTNWTLDSASCSLADSEGSLDNDEFLVGPGDEITCTFLNTFHQPETPPQCSDNVDNADSEDTLSDEADLGCWTDPNDSETYNPNDNDETNPTDVCPDDAGIQTNENQCRDVCPNIDGIQTEVPRGKHLNGSGNCVSSSSGGGSGGHSTPPPQVLGAEICSAVDTYMRRGYKNNATEVLKVQAFLNGYMHSTLVVDGLYGPLTEASVKAFQVARKDMILTPWHLTLPTGIFYKTSLAEAKRLMCPETFGTLPIPTDLIPWSKNPSQVPAPVN